MLDATLNPDDLQNSAIFPETVNVYLGGHNSDSEMQKKHPNVAIYLRVSTDDQTVESQLLSLRFLILANGFEPEECTYYIDDGVSAWKKPSFTDRPQGARMMQDVEDGKITHIFATYANRMFRKVSAGSTWLDYMADKHPEVIISTTEGMDSRTVNGRMMWFIMLGVAETENGQKSVITKGGMERTQEQLGRSSHAIFGWEWNDEIEQMQPNWHQQAVIRHIKESWDDNKGQSYNAIAKDLNRWGIKTSTGRDWNAGSIRRSIHTPPKMQQQLHQFNEPKRMITAPFRGYKA